MSEKAFEVCLKIIKDFGFRVDQISYNEYQNRHSNSRKDFSLIIFY